jgi:hypothetical protein
LYFSDPASIWEGEQYSFAAAALIMLQILRIANIGGMRGVGGAGHNLCPDYQSRNEFFPD